MKTFNELINEFAIEMARKNAPISRIELANEEGLEKISQTFVPKDSIRVSSKNIGVHITSVWTTEGQVFLSVKKEETPNNEAPILPNTFGVEYCSLEMSGLSMKVMYRLTTPVGKGIWKEYSIPFIFLQLQDGKTISQIVEEKAKEDLKEEIKAIVNQETDSEEALKKMFDGFTVVELELVPKGKR